MIKVIDLFAGPGGLSEGFSRVKDRNKDQVFDVVLSIEKEFWAYQTLKLRTFSRAFENSLPETYYSYLRGEIELNDLYVRHQTEAEEAEKKCWNFELKDDIESVRLTRSKIIEALREDRNFVLIGGPPCQAYSIAGRSRNARNTGYDETKDEKQVLYKEYLQILADHEPVIFIMENVKGLLSSEYQNEKIVDKIMKDLENPKLAMEQEGREVCNPNYPEYSIYSLVDGELLAGRNPSYAVIRSERYGIPQKRHRVILLGIRKDITGVKPLPLETEDPVELRKVINDLPKLRSGLSKEEDSLNDWIQAITSVENEEWFKKLEADDRFHSLAIHMKQILSDIRKAKLEKGKHFVEGDFTVDFETEWYRSSNSSGVTLHNTRSHIRRDLHRYLFSTCFANVKEKSPVLDDFPEELLPDHANVKKATRKNGNFADRFRVQLYDRPSTTVVSHISKDGHYYIHPDPVQCRSFTVREAARVQTFPDNYYFCGKRTSQYQQVGNAVPPLLARKIGQVVYDILNSSGLKMTSKFSLENSNLK
jgi:DNA (cytosine-5)-methyltransferase 1